MIDIKEKKDCCGCSACVQCCPKQCISMCEDEEGFLYPKVDTSLCIECGLCEKVCPVINQDEPRQPLKVYAAINRDEKIRAESSSGGIFTLLAEKIINEGGVVFGARFDENWEVKHDYTETIEGLSAFRGSKYVQSRIENTYQEVKNFLKQNRKVLFSGTPCQVAGLKKFLRKDYQNLTTLDFVCHGVPSPKVWRIYLKEIIARMCDKNSVSHDPISMENTLIESISFRDKCSGWKKFSFSLTLSATTRSGAKNTVSHCEIFPKNTFMKGFLADLYLRPSCYNCPAKCGKSNSDITIGDLWGANSLIGTDDDCGTSLIIVNNRLSFIDDSSLIFIKEINYQSVINFNPVLEKSVKIPPKRSTFYLGLKNEQLENIVNKLTIIPFEKKILNCLKRILKRVLSH